jgi:hypothetical protein
MTLSTYIEDFLGNLYSYLDYSAGDVAFITDETLEALNISSESEASSKSLHAIARVKALEKCLNDLSVDFKVSTDGNSYDRQQVFDMVSKRLESAYADAETYLPENVIVNGEITYPDNPYKIETYIEWAFPTVKV